MTTDDYTVRVTADVKDFVSNIDRAGSMLSKINAGVATGSKALSSLEREFISASQSAKKLVAALGDQAKAMQTADDAMHKMISDYDAVDKRNRALAGTYKESVQGLTGEAVARQKSSEAAKANAQAITDEQKVRASELGSLRAAIEARNAEAQAAQKAATVAERAAAAEQSAAQKAAAAEQRASEQAAKAAQRAAATEAKAAQSAAAAQQKMVEQQNKLANNAAMKNMAAAMAQVKQRAAEAAAEMAKMQAAAQKAATNTAVSQANANPFNAQLLNGMKGTAAYSETIENSLSGLANQRYALYDVAASLGVISGATLGLPSAAIAVGASYEAAFADVERTTGETGDQLDALYTSLTNISDTLPVAFSDVTGIATLGAQLGIANDDIAGFTKTVAEFSATTDVTTEAAATGFGRLAQLTKTPQANISNLASSIYEVGINSVATESDVLNMAQQLATTGNQAGFTQTEIIGLSGALASLGVAPEQARSAVMRIFGDIDGAVGEGGDALNDFAKISGETANQFAQQWKTAPQDAFNAYLKGLDEVKKKTGKSTNTTLIDQGFSNVRDRNVLTRLSANMDVYTQTLTDAESAYKANTALADGYAVVADTLSAKLKVLGNSVKTLIAGFTELGPIKVFVSALTSIVTWLNKFGQTGAGKAIASVVLAFSGLIGVVAAVGGSATLIYASMLAVVTALGNTVRSSGQATLSLRALTVQLITASKAGQSFALSMRAASVNGVSSTIGQAGRAATVAGKSFLGAVFSVKAFTTALKGIASATLLGAALVALPLVISKISKSFSDGKSSAQDYFGSLDGLSEALTKDTATYNETHKALGTITETVKTSNKELTPWAQSLQTAADTQVNLSDATETTSTKIDTQTIAIGKNAKAWLANAVANNEKFQDAWKKNGDAIQATTFNFQDFINASTKDPGNGGYKYITGLIQKYKDLESAQTVAGRQASASGNSAGLKAANDQAAAYKKSVDALKGLRDAGSASDDALATTAAKMNLLQVVSDQTGQSMKELGVTVNTSGEQIDEAADDATNLADKMNDAATAAFANVNALSAVNDALYQLGEGIANNGLDFSTVTDAGRQNLSNLSATVTAMAAQANGDATVFGNSIIGLIESLQAQGVDTQNQLGSLFTLLNQEVGKQYNLNFTTQDARTNLASFLSDAANGLGALESALNAALTSALQINNVVNGVETTGVQNARAQGPSAAPGITAQITALKASAAQAANTKDVYNNATTQMNAGMKSVADSADKASKSTKGVGDSADKAAKEVRTLVDYASDLKSVLDRDIEIRFSVQDAKDAVSDAKQKIADTKKALQDNVNDDRSDISDLTQQWKDATADVKKYQQQINGLKNSNKVLKDQLKIAKAYGETDRVNELQSQIDQNNSDITDATKSKSDAQKDASDDTKKLAAANKKLTQDLKDLNTGLKGNSEQARINRKNMEDLTQAYLDELDALAKNGASQDTIKAKAAQFQAQLAAQGAQLGYTKGQVATYTDALGDVPDIVNKVPKNITTTVNANKNPAQTAIDEFINKNKSKSVTVGVNAKTPSNNTASNAGRSAGNSYTGGFNKRATPVTKTPTNDSTDAGKNHGKNYGYGWVLQVDSARKIYARKDPKVPGGYVYKTKNGPSFFNKGGQVPGGKRVEYHATGGVGGVHPGAPKGSDTVPAWLTPGETVTKKAAVDYYGLPFMNAINNMQLPRYYAQGSTVGGNGNNGIQVVELLPGQLQQLSRMVSTQVQLDGKVVAESTNGYNRNNSVRGAN